MEVLAKAVGAMQVSVDSFRGESRASAASSHVLLTELAQRITKAEEGLNRLDTRLDNMEQIQAALVRENRELKELTYNARPSRLLNAARIKFGM